MGGAFRVIRDTWDHSKAKVFTLQTLPDCRPDNPLAHTVGKVAGFSLPAGVATKAHERDKQERLCRRLY